jgi:hypothetical protein
LNIGGHFNQRREIADARHRRRHCGSSILKAAIAVALTASSARAQIDAPCVEDPCKLSRDAPELGHVLDVKLAPNETGVVYLQETNGGWSCTVCQLRVAHQRSSMCRRLVTFKESS